MAESLEQDAVKIINGNVKNVHLISYFKHSTIKTPVFLSVIQRNYAEIRPLLNNGLIHDFEPVKSYELHIDKLENFFYQKYQGRIDDLKDEIWRRKRNKTKIVQFTETMEPEKGSSDYDQKLQECLQYARNAIKDLDLMEHEKEEYNYEVGALQESMKIDPIYRFLMFIRNDRELIFNKRVEDNESVVLKKVYIYSEKSLPGKGRELFNELKKNGFFKAYSPAKNYYISDLGLSVDRKLREINWDQEIEDCDKTEEEQCQEKEFNKLKEELHF
jgi:hypothetical protein